jgi:hypothetical protein
MSIKINSKNNFKYSRKESTSQEQKINDLIDSIRSRMYLAVIGGGLVSALGHAGITAFREHQKDTYNRPPEQQITSKLDRSHKTLENPYNVKVESTFDNSTRQLNFGIFSGKNEKVIQESTSVKILENVEKEFPGFPRNVEITKTKDGITSIHITVPFEDKNEVVRLKAVTTVPATPEEIPTEWDSMQKQKAIDRAKIKRAFVEKDYIESGVEHDQSNAYTPSRDKKIGTTTTEYDDIQAEKKQKAQKATDNKNIKGGN